MTVEQTKELIKLNTEILKFYFVIFVGLGTGEFSLMTSGDFTTPRKIFLLLGGVGLGATLLLIFERVFRIRVFIKQL